MSWHERLCLTHIDYFLAHYGYGAIFALLMLGIVGPLIPDDTILVLSGVAIHRGQLDPWATLAVAYAGSLCGITLSYILGRTGAVYALGRIPAVSSWMEKYLPQVQSWFDKYGKWTLFFGYFIAGIRHFTALAAGISNVRVRTFVLYAFPGGFVWVALFLSIGYYLGAEWEQLKHRFDRGALIGAGIFVAVGIAGWWLRTRKTSQEKN